MKIKKVEIKDYKAFYGKNEFNVDGKMNSMWMAKTFLSMVKTEVVKVLFTMR